MHQVTEFFKNLFSTADFQARWASGVWSNFHGWLYIISDILIWAAFVAIPIIIIRFISGRRHLIAFNNIYFLFAAFILSAGFTQLTDAVLFWIPLFRFDGLLKFITAVISWITVFALIKALPKAFAFKTAQELQSEIDLRIKVEQELETKNRQLSEAEKIAKIGYGHWDLINDKIVLSDQAYDIYSLPKGTQLSFDSFINIVHPDDRDKVRNIAYKIIATRHFNEFEFRIIANGIIKYLRINGEIKYDRYGNIIMMIGILQDITEKQQSLNRIEQQNNMLMEIASIHSHNVRGPLATIMGLASMFNEKDVTDPDNVLIIEGIKVASENLDKIVTDIVQKSWSVEILKQPEPVAVETRA